MLVCQSRGCLLESLGLNIEHVKTTSDRGSLKLQFVVYLVLCMKYIVLQVRVFCIAQFKEILEGAFLTFLLRVKGPLHGQGLIFKQYNSTYENPLHEFHSIV